jgi:hypothetical protein
MLFFIAKVSDDLLLAANSFLKAGARFSCELELGLIR